ncbi:MAG: hypothetical protein D6725_07675 [Planctomycetota bacterium]|nr:MAG: hypothetical protein D6725_07675 [Planctomycetota bacterium]
MGRRTQGGNGGASLDSLLDTMTNVVGILVILLAVTQLGVGDAVKRISEKLPEISEQELAEAERRAEEIERRFRELQAEVQSIQADPLAGTSPEIDPQQLQKLRESVEQLRRKRVDVEKLRKDVESKRKLVEKLQQQSQQELAEVARLRALLEATPEPDAPPPPKVVYLPNPRKAPEKAKPVLFMCRGGRILPIDEPQLRMLIQKQIELVRGKGKPGTVDCKRLIEHFEKRNIGDRWFRVKVVVRRGVPVFELHPRENAGETLERLKRSTADFRRVFLRRIDPQRQYIRFLVWSDSFDVYLEARRLATERKILAGWVPFPAGAQWGINPGVRVTCSDQPPPPAPPPSTKPKPLRPLRPVPVDEID